MHSFETEIDTQACNVSYLVFGIQIVRPNSTIHIRYSDYLKTEEYSVFGIRIFSILNSIWYSVFGFSQYRIVFGIWYLDFLNTK